jgi:hypothetical protein
MKRANAPTISDVGPGHKSTTVAEQEQPRGDFSVLPLLHAEGELPAEVRQALLAGRSRDAAEMLIQQYGLNCDEASDLLDVFACE